MKKQTKMKKIISNILVFALVFSSGVNTAGVQAKTKTPKLNKSSITLKKGRSKTVRLQNVSAKKAKKAKWSIKSGKSCVKLTVKKSKSSVKVTARKKGNAKIQCKILGKKLILKVKVTDGSNASGSTAMPSVVPATTAPASSSSIIPPAVQTPVISAPVSTADGGVTSSVPVPVGTAEEETASLAPASAMPAGTIIPAAQTDKPSEYPDSKYYGISDELVDAVKEIAAPYYEMSGEIAAKNATGRWFTDHKMDHAEMVADKSYEAGYAIKNAVLHGGMGKEADTSAVGFSGDISFKTLITSAYVHDIGMSGGGLALSVSADSEGNKVFDKDEDGYYVLHEEDDEEYSEIRSNHSLNSALYVLTNRERFLKLGFTDTEVDQIAVECMAHSKSYSGVTDLNSSKNWTDCFDRMDSLVRAYNGLHAEDMISFERKAFEDDGALLSSTASETLALRIGDVSRDSGPDVQAQSGELVHVDQSSVNSRGGSMDAEIQDAVVTIGEAGDICTNDKDKLVHIGEQNISDNCTYVSADYLFTHVVTVADGAIAPKCTQTAIEEHLGELYSAKKEKFHVYIIFESFEDTDGYFKKSYEAFTTEMNEKYENVDLNIVYLTEDVVPVTWEPSADDLIIRSEGARNLYTEIKSGHYPEIGELKADAVVSQIDELSAYYKVKYGNTGLLETPEREKLREKILNDFLNIGSARTERIDESSGYHSYVYDGEIASDYKMELVLGLPAAGKSSRVTDPDSEADKAFILDCDVIKEMIPEYQESHGCGADAVHFESMSIMEDAIREFTDENGSRRGQNVIIPLVAGDLDDLMENYIRPFEAAGYHVKAKYVDVEENVSMSRNIARELETGRIINSAVVFSFGNTPKEVYEKLAAMENADGESYDAGLIENYFIADPEPEKEAA